MRKVFLGGLPRSTTDDRLRELFAKYGEILDYVVMKDSKTRESRGFGFIEFASEESVDLMLNDRPITIDGREIEVRRAMPRNLNHSTIHEKTKRLFIGGLNHSVTEDDIRNYFGENFSKYGKIEQVEIKRDRETNVSRGFGFVTFDSEDAVDAILLKEPRPTQFGRNCEVKKSEPRRQDDQPGSRRERSDRRMSPVGRRRDRNPDRDRRSPIGRFDDRARERSRQFSEREYEISPPRDRGMYGGSAMYGDPYNFERSYSGGPSSEYQHSYSAGRPFARGGPPSRNIEYDGYVSRSLGPSYNQRSGPPREEPGYRGYFRPPY